jgi:hypothetical protein
MLASDQMKFGKRIIFAVGIVGLMVLWLTGRNRPAKAARSVPAAGNTAAESVVAKEVKKKKNPRIFRRRSRWLKLVLCLTTSAASVFVYVSHYRIVAAILLLAAVVLATIFAQAPKRADDFWFVLLLTLLSVGQAFVIVTVAGLGVASTIRPAALIPLVTYGFVGACVAGVAVAKWLAGSDFAEPTALGIAAVLLIFVCLPGLIGLMQPLNIPRDNGDALLLLTNPHDQKVTLNVATFGIDKPTYENFDLNIQGSQRVRWVLVLSGSARMARLSSSGHISVRTITEPPNTSRHLVSSREIQLVSGYTDYNNSVSINGRAVGTFASFNSDRIAVTLPYYAIGAFGDLSLPARNMVRKLLGADSTFPIHSKIIVFSGPFDATETLTGSIPPPRPVSSQYGMLEWSSYLGQPISYTALYQDLSDLTTITLFLLAFLLGVAGAGLFGSLQSGIHLYLLTRSANPKSEKERR